MGKQAKETPQPPRPTRKLHLGPWLSRLGKRPVDVANAVGIGESYVSSLISGKPKEKNPTPTVLIEISEFLGITVNDLYRPPPSPEVMEALRQLPPAQIAALVRIIDAIGTGWRRKT